MQIGNWYANIYCQGCFFGVVLLVRIFQLLLVCLVVSAVAQLAMSQHNTVSVEVDGVTVSGQAMGYDGKQLALLLRDGQVRLIKASNETIKPLEKPSQPYSHTLLRDAFFKEYRNRYDVSTTENYVVIHPWGDASTWAKPFNDFHNQFMSYFESKGFKLKRPEFPLVAFVLRSRNDFERSLINESQWRDARIAGYYSRATNRITTYDPAGQLRLTDDPWMYSSWPIIHEATHQSAFNTGVHNRFAPPPIWLAEGLATMFEAKGIHDHQHHTRATDRVNVRRLKQLRKFLDKNEFRAGMINLVANDKLFRSHLEMAYGLSWGLAFYLAETKEKEFFEFIARDAKRKNFVPYRSEQRLRDFAKAFGNDFDKLAQDMRRYYRVKK